MGRTTKFAYDEQNRKVKHWLPLSLSPETWRYDRASAHFGVGWPSFNACALMA
jgi:hypothetical protein